MKNIIYSTIIIIFTIITVCVLVVIKNNYCKMKAGDDEVLALKNNVTESRLKNKKVKSEADKINKSKIKESEVKMIDEKAQNDQNSNISKKQTTIKAEVKKNNGTNSAKGAVNTADTNQVADVKNSNNNEDNIENSDEAEKNIPVFKVAKSDVIDKLTVKDKATLLLIGKSLSKEDYNIIQQDLNSEDDKQGLSSAIRLLKNRLDAKDFNKIKEIAAKVINLDSLTF